MKCRIPIAATLLAALLGAGAAQADQHRKQLFNGKDLAGWSHAGKGSFLVEEGALKTEGGMGLLWYEGEKFGDAVIRVVYKSSSETANSGVFIRIPKSPTTPGSRSTSGMRCRSTMSGTSSIAPGRSIRCRALKSFLHRVPGGIRWRSSSKDRQQSSA